MFHSSYITFSNNGNDAGGKDNDSNNIIIDSTVIVLDDDEAIDAASHAATEAYRQSSPQKGKARKRDKVHLPSPPELL